MQGISNAYCYTSQICSSGGIICSVGAMDTYIHQLRMHNAIAACDDSLREFVVQDFSLENLSLKVRYTCTCSGCSCNLLYCSLFSAS